MRFFTSCFGDNDAYNPRHGGRRVVTKAMIGLPSNFVHTGHLGIGAVRNDGYEMVQDTEKLKNLMTQVGAALDDDTVTDFSKNSRRLTQESTIGMGFGVTC